MPFSAESRSMHSAALALLPHLSVGLAWIVFTPHPVLADPFAAFVVRYDPAPGQFVNNEKFNDPTKTLGPPKGGGTGAADNSSVVTLGGIGGSITLAFDHTVEDDWLNPFGMDAIVFGNAFWSAPTGVPDPNLHFSEAAIIEISLDENGNGVADDPWFLIPGSHFEEITLTQNGYELPDDPFGASVVINPSPDPTVEGIFGYAEYSPTLVLGDLNVDNVVDDPTVAPEDFYTVPDDPFTVGITHGSGGGDAFDIAWAIDPDTGLPADLPAFDFIRITTAVDAFSALFGEKSAEIDAVADVAPDPFGDFDDDGDIDLLDIAALQNCFGVDTALEPNCERMDREPDGFVDLTDAVAVIDRTTGPQ